MEPDCGQHSVDVAIVGAGPAGLSAALELGRAGGPRVALLELGRDHVARPCPVDAGLRCQGCGGVCHVISGFGGCLHHGDGAKISLMPCARHLARLLGEARAQQLSDATVGHLERWLGQRLELAGQQVPAAWHQIFERRGLSIREYPVAVLAEQQLGRLLRAMREELTSLDRCELRLGHSALDVRRDARGFCVELRQGARVETLRARQLILAGGRRAVREHAAVLQRLGVGMDAPTASTGVRLEMPATLLQTAGRAHPDLKVNARHADGHKLKTFCFCAGPGGGRLKLTNYQDSFGEALLGLDGHVVVEPGAAGNHAAANFAVLVQSPQAARDGERWLVQEAIPRYRAVAGGRPLVQRLGDFVARRAPQEDWALLRQDLGFSPSLGDLTTGPVHALFDDDTQRHLAQGSQRILDAILEASALAIDARTLARQVLVVGPELEFLWPRVQVDASCQTAVPGLFVVGDAAGHGQGILPAMITGAAAAQAILAVARA